jgi:peptide/nickel transport system permease protein
MMSDQVQIKNPVRDAVALVLRYRNFVIGMVLTGMVIISAFLSTVWTPHSAVELNIRNRTQLPSLEHWLGTDHLGRDILSMIMVGAQNSLIVGIVAVSIGLIIGVGLGLWAASKRGWTEELVMRFSDFTFAFPAVLSAIMITAILGPGAVNSILAIGIFNIPVFARIARGAANAIWAREFIMAARAAGKGDFRITIEHVLPNITSVIVVQATISFAIAILAEAALSYLGIGTQPPEPSWGRMLNDAQTYITFKPWLAIFPGAAIFLAVLGLNMLGDGLRDILDPRLTRGR